MIKRANINKGVTRKQGTPHFPKNQHFLPPDKHTCVYVSEVKKCLFFRIFGVPCFLETPVLRFALLPYCQQIDVANSYLPPIKILLKESDALLKSTSPIVFQRPSFTSNFSALFRASLLLIPPTAYITWCADEALRGSTFAKADWERRFGSKKYSIVWSSKSLRCKNNNAKNS